MVSEPARIAEQIKEGVPNGLRGEVWKKLLDTESAKNSSIYSYSEEVKHVLGENAVVPSHTHRSRRPAR